MEELKQELAIIEEQTKEIIVNSQESYQIAVGFIINLDQWIKRATAEWEDIRVPAYDSYQNILKKKKEYLDPALILRKRFQKKNDDYLTEQENIRKAEQKRLDDERKKKEDAEKEKLLRKAEKFESSGNVERAEEMLNKAENVYIPPSIVAPMVDKTTRLESGTASSTTDINVIIQDSKEILKGIIAGIIPISVVAISEAKLKAHVKAFKLKTLPGCIIEEKQKAIYRTK
jgi:hypothetical protein